MRFRKNRNLTKVYLKLVEACFQALFLSIWVRSKYVNIFERTLCPVVIKKR